MNDELFNRIIPMILQSGTQPMDMVKAIKDQLGSVDTLSKKYMTDDNGNRYISLISHDRAMAEMASKNEHSMLVSKIHDRLEESGIASVNERDSIIKMILDDALEAITGNKL